MPVDPITSDIVIQVSNAQELQDAYATLSNTVGGGRIELLGDAEGMGILLRGGGSEPVHITSADTSDPVALSFISLNDVDNVRISDVDVDNTGVDFPSGSGGFGIADSEAIELSNVTFTGPATSFFDPNDPDAVPTVSLGSVRGSNDILISDIHGSGYKHGLTITETSEITFTDNTFTELQGDGLRMGGVQDVTISDNHFHDFLGSTNGYNHDDMIQVWSTNTTMVNGDITITGNILDRGDGNTTQAIFFRNERYEVTRDPDHIYENITISDNLIYNSHYHGITVAHADNVTVTDNTLLWNTSSGVAPRINLGGATNVTATGNVTPHLGLPEGAEANGNLVLDYADTLSENFVGNHIVNPLTPGGVELSELRLRPDSDYVGTGSPFSDPVLTTEDGVEAVVTITADLEDPQTLLLDAGFSIDENGFLNEEDYTFTWHLPNGSTQEGATIAYRLDTPGNAEVGLTITHGGEVVAEEEYGLFVEDATYFSLNAETGFDDQSSYDSEVFNSGAELVDTNNGAAFHIGGSDYFGLSLNNDQIHGLPGFNLSMEMQVLNSSQGDFVRMGSTMQGSIQWDGTLTYVLRTDEGAFNLNSGDVKVDDGLLHDITIHYSNEDGVLELHIDGDVVDSVAASGITSPNPENSLFIGSPWNPTVEALVMDVTLSANPYDTPLLPDEPEPLVEPKDLDSALMPQVLPQGVTPVGQSDGVTEDPAPEPTPDGVTEEPAPEPTPDGVTEDPAPEPTPDGVTEDPAPEPTPEVVTEDPTPAPMPGGGPTPGGVPTPQLVAEGPAPEPTPEPEPEPAPEVVAEDTVPEPTPEVVVEDPAPEPTPEVVAEDPTPAPMSGGVPTPGGVPMSGGVPMPQVVAEDTAPESTSDGVVEDPAPEPTPEVVVEDTAPALTTDGVVEDTAPEPTPEVATEGTAPALKPGGVPGDITPVGAAPDAAITTLMDLVASSSGGLSGGGSLQGHETVFADGIGAFEPEPSVDPNLQIGLDIDALWLPPEPDTPASSMDTTYEGDLWVF